MYKLVITYEGPCGGEGRVVYEDPPSLCGKEESVIFAKGVLVDREITFNRLLEVEKSSVLYSAYDDGLKALSDET